MEDTAILISADHGESLGELGIYSEHGTADEATCRIPMIVRWPGGKKGIVEEGLHYHLDLGPTLASLLNLKGNLLLGMVKVMQVPFWRGIWEGVSIS